MSVEASTAHASSSAQLPPTSTPTSFRSRESGLIRGSILSNLRDDYDKDAFKGIRDLLDTLHAAEIPGPQLLRMQTDFKSRIGRGAQGSVHVAHRDYKEQLQILAAHHLSESQYNSFQSKRQLKASCLLWTHCAIKQLRHDNRRKLESQIATALNEVKCLCNDYIIRSKYVVTLQGWGLDLDSLEGHSLSAPRLPLLIFERAECDLAAFIDAAADHDSAPFNTWDDDTLSAIALDIGRGLQAIHKAKLCHGDVKLDNILVFRSGINWRAKICDMGSATDASRPIPADRYLGTNGWKAPETLIANQLVDAIRCDIFSYGLVIWSIFMRTSRSLMEDLDVDNLVDKLGEQRIYAAAKRAVCRIYFQHGEPAPSTLVRRHSAISADSPRLDRDSNSHIRIPELFVTYLRRQSVVSRSLISSDFGPKANRLLTVLRGCLDEQAGRRDLEPWKLFLPAIKTPLQVLDPETFEKQARPVPYLFPTDTSANRSAVWAGLLRAACSSSLTWFMIQWIRHQTRFSVLRPRFPRHSMFLRYHAILADVLGPDVSSISLLQHTNEDCVSASPNALKNFRKEFLSSRLKIEQGGHNWTWHDGRSYADSLYSLARLRSRFRSCCWDKMMSDARLNPQMQKVFRDIELNFADETLTWALRNKDTGYLSKYTMKELRYSMSERGDSAIEFDTTNRLLTLMDCDVFIGQRCEYPPHSANEMSFFEQYLRTLKSPSRVYEVVRHSKRIARSEGATASAKFWYTGWADDSGGKHVNASDQDYRNTCLHDAVRAGSYIAVQFLCRSGFNVLAVDSRGKTAFDIATEGLDYTARGGLLIKQGSQLERNDIIALFHEHPAFADRRPVSGLPLGWETVPYVDNRATKLAFMETSVPTDAQPITFIQPTVSLLQDRRLLLAERDGSDGNMFYMNPPRFVQREPSQSTHSQSRHAETKEFDDEYFRKDVENTMRMSVSADQDERWWYRMLARFVQSFGVSTICNSIQVVTVVTLIISIRNGALSQYRMQLLSGLFALSGFLSLTAHKSMELAYHFFTGFYTKFDVSLVSSLTDFLIGLSALICGQARLAQWLFIGSVLCDVLLIFGCSILVAGFRLSENLVLFPVPVLSIGTFAYLPAILAWSVGIDAINLQHDRGQQDFILRAAAIICIMLSAAYVHFRYITHTKLFDYSEVDEFIEPVRRFHPWPEFIEVPAETRRPSFAVSAIKRRAKLLLIELYIMVDYYTYLPIWWAIGSFILCLVGLTAASFCVGHAASHLTPQMTFLAGSFVIPLAVRSLYIIHAAVMAYNNRMDLVCDLTLGPARRMVMLTGPLWTIISWIWGLDFVLLLDTHQIVLWGLTLSILFFTPQLFYKTNIMIGILFICLYAMMVLSMFLRSEDSL